MLPPTVITITASTHSSELRSQWRFFLRLVPLPGPVPPGPFGPVPPGRTDARPAAPPAGETGTDARPAGRWLPAWDQSYRWLEPSGPSAAGAAGLAGTAAAAETRARPAAARPLALGRGGGAAYGSAG